MKILVIDDEPSICKTLSLYFESKHEVLTSSSLEEGENTLEHFQPDLLLLDLRLPDGSALQLLEKMRNAGDSRPVIIITGHSDMESPIQAMRLGATDYIRKPLDIEEIEVALTRVQSSIIQPKDMHDISSEVFSTEKNRIIGHSRAITEVLKQIGLVSQEKITVLITGESGTGKELVARAVHSYSNPEKPFVAVNCPALVHNLFESELFGHEKGSYTGAQSKRIGRMETAGAGTLFLDEISELPDDLQTKLLRVLQEREFERVGGNKRIPLKARVISASNKNLLQMVRKKQFREDLYYRLCINNIHVASLRERSEDIPELVDYLLQQINHVLHKKIKKVPEDVLKSLQKYSWPGNVRELKNVLMRSALLCTGNVFHLAPNSLITEVVSSEKEEITSLAEMEKRHIQKILNHTHNNISQASKILGISRPTLRKKINDYGLSK